jgi:hypothetical protein
MVALPVIEVEKFPLSPSQDPDANCNVPFIEEEVTLALKEAVSAPVIVALKIFPVTVPSRVPLFNVHPVPVIDAEPLTLSEPFA